MNIGVISDTSNNDFDYDPTNLIELGKALREALTPAMSVFEDLARLIEECGHLLYSDPTPPREYARIHSKSRGDLYKACRGCTDVYIRITPKNLPYMRRPR